MLGLPGAGKTTVAPLVAEELGTDWCDLDQRIVLAEGRSISAIFAEDGEAAFRGLERKAMAQALASAPMVIAPGGGWAAEPGNLREVGDQALVLYLYVSPEVAADRLGPASDRPLLAGDPLPRLRELLALREPSYRSAACVIEAFHPPDVVVKAVVETARRLGGWLPAAGGGGY